GQEMNVDDRNLAYGADRQAVSATDLFLHGPQPPADVVQVVVDARFGEDVERGESGAGADRVAVERAARPGQLRSREASSVEHAHDVGLPDETGHREPASHRLAVGGNVRDNAVAL